jgi:hypothetical protein
MQFFASLRAFSLIDNKTEMKANAIMGVVMKSPQCEYFRVVERTNERATFVTKRKGDPEVSLTFTIEDGRRGYAKRDSADPSKPDAKAWDGSGYTRNPADQLVARASSKLARLVYPDVVFNLYAPEEFD